MEEKVFESKSLIRFPDCDPFNHLNNARYIDYFINAREDHLMRFHDFNIYQYAAEQSVSWVVSKNQIAYLRPAFLMETVIITSTVRSLREKDIIVELMMWNEEKSSIKALLWCNFVHVNMKTQRTENHSEALLKKFRPYENPFNPAVSFDERIEGLRKA